MPNKALKFTPWLRHSAGRRKLRFRRPLAWRYVYKAAICEGDTYRANHRFLCDRFLGFAFRAAIWVANFFAFFRLRLFCVLVLCVFIRTYRFRVSAQNRAFLVSVLDVGAQAFQMAVSVIHNKSFNPQAAPARTGLRPAA